MCPSANAPDLTLLADPPEASGIDTDAAEPS